MCILTFTGAAQDAHYSQFYASPVNLNPAFTGVTNSKYRAAVQLRNQGNSLGAPLTAYGITYDMNFNRKTFTNFFWGGGISVNSEIADEWGYNYNSFLVSAAYHLVLNKRNMISFGLQTGLGQVSFPNLEDRTFPDNNDGYTYSTGIGSDAAAFQNTLNYDLNSGISYLGKINRHNIFAGASIYHIVPSAKGNRKMRYTAHMGTKFKILERFRFTPHFIYNAQGEFNELNIGTNFELNLPDNTDPEMIASLGTYYRLSNTVDGNLASNALIIVGGLSFQTISVGISYDINLAPAREFSNLSQGFELSLVYEGSIYSSKKRRITIGCPKW